MDEKNLLKFWNTQRSHVIHSQLSSAIVLIGILVLATLGGFESAPNKVKYLAIGIAAATGILAIISQYAAIREGEAVALDLQKVKDSSKLGKKIAESGSFLSLTAFAIVAMGIGIFALTTWAVLGK